MAVAGYSGTPLVNKLGIRPGHRLALLSAPSGFAEELDLPDGVTVITRLSGHCDVVLFFTKGRNELDRRVERIGQVIAPAGAAWIAWPKRAAKVATDMTEDVVREVALPRGLVDVKVCAIDETWSGLKLVWRKERR
ncbi:MAG: hypothetical protein QOF30_723 [Acidimicrobiaceae bacterium]|jgi:hypothetical protein|nr:hypothetical protein [Acidimicrobiaceae bacterium]